MVLAPVRLEVNDMHRFLVPLIMTTTTAWLLTTQGCIPDQSLPPPGEAERRAFALQLADGFVLPRLARLQSQADAVVDATSALAAGGGVDIGARSAAREALTSMLVTWQQLEVMQLGPAGSSSTFTGGLGLRDGIDSWPLVSPCGADQQVVQNLFGEPGWAAGRLVNVLGTHTLEYLLFRDDVDNACPAAAAINDAGTWAALSPADITSRRAVYAHVLAEDIAARVRTLSTSWTAGFAEQLRTAGTPGSLFSTAQQALDESYAALFFLELKTKDRKLAVPAGLHIDCAADVCPELTESPFSRLSKSHVEQNLVAGRLLLLGEGDDGQDGVGFDDLLRSGGHADAAATMMGTIDAAIDAVATFDGSFEDALQTEPQRVRDLLTAVKTFTDELKSTLPSLLGLRVPDEGAGDND